MAEFSKISWTDGTFNPWIGCSRVSPGCENCYAENQMDRRYGRVKWGPGNPRSRTKTWNQPIKWNKEAEASGVRKKVFCASLADWLDEEVPTQWREDLFDLIEKCTSIDWLMLTKRIQNYESFVPHHWLDSPLKNVWVGTTAENQTWWDKRVPILEKIPAALRWVSYEPALGPIDMPVGVNIDWVIIGGESQQTMEARPFQLEWAERMIFQCRVRRIVPFMKQKGTMATHNGILVPCEDRAGADPAEWPALINVQEFPLSPVLT